MKFAYLVLGATTLFISPGFVYGQSVDLLGELTRPIPGKSHRASSSNPDLAKNGDAVTVNEGETYVLADLAGPGVINHLWCTIGSKDPFAGRSLVLRIYWDGESKPSVVAPLGDFFGVGHGAWASFHSLPVATSSFGRSRNCFWRMPFRKSAKITITNDSKGYGGTTFYYYVDWRSVPSLPDDSLYFHAHYRQAFPALPGDYTIVDTKGRGHYVGTVYNVQHTKLGWFGEGDDRFTIDGDETPSIRGTGTEDYFGDAWGFREFAAPMNGVSLWEGYFPGDRATAYRWHLTDPISFDQSLRLTIEHRGSLFTDQGVQKASFDERPDWLSSVAFWYQTPPATFDETLPPAEKRIAPYRVIPIKEMAIKAKPAIVLMKQDTGLTYIPRKPDAVLSMEFEVPEDGRYVVSGVIFRGMLVSMYQAYLDDKPLGPVLDLYMTGFDPSWINFDQHDLKAGKHTIRFEGRGNSPNARSQTPPLFAIAINSIILLRLEDLEGYK